MFRALRVRNFRIYASANLVSLTGTWMQRIGQDWLVLQLSDDSGIALGLITALQFGPTPAAEHVRRGPGRPLRQAPAAADHPGADGRAGAGARHPGRHRRRRPVARLRAGRRRWARSRPSTPRCGSRSSRRWSARSCWPTRSSLNSTIFNGARLVGPSLAGLLIGAASGDTAPAFFVNAASFAFTIGALAGMRAAELRPSPPVARARGQLRAGVAYTWAHPDLVLAMVLAFVIGTFGFNYQVTIALMARERFDLGRRGVRAALDRSSPSARSPARCCPPGAASGRGSGSSSVSAVVFGAAHRRRRPDAELRRRSPCCWCRPAPPRWCSAWPTTASCSSASTRRCAAGSWRCTSCASWAARPSVPR